jgi:hypothetical protein
LIDHKQASGKKKKDATNLISAQSSDHHSCLLMQKYHVSSNHLKHVTGSKKNKTQAIK